MNNKEERDFFATKAGEYDAEERRVQNVINIADAIMAELSFNKDMRVMDFGSGTGLLLAQIAPHVKEIIAVDVSDAMNDALRSKLNTIEGEVKMVDKDLTKETLDDEFDAVISSMTCHHIEDVQKLFENFYSMLKKGGTIGIADLDKEDGSFHSEDTGVHHLGFEREEIMSYAEGAGFKDLKIQTASVVVKDSGEFPVFLLTGRK